MLQVNLEVSCVRFSVHCIYAIYLMTIFRQFVVVILELLCPEHIVCTLLVLK